MSPFNDTTNTVNNIHRSNRNNRIMIIDDSTLIDAASRRSQQRFLLIHLRNITQHLGCSAFTDQHARAFLETFTNLNQDPTHSQIRDYECQLIRSIVADFNVNENSHGSFGIMINNQASDTKTSRRITSKNALTITIIQHMFDNEHFDFSPQGLIALVQLMLYINSIFNLDF